MRSPAGSCAPVISEFYRVPDQYIGRRIWTILKGDTLRIECGKEVVARYRIKTDYLKASPTDSSDAEKSDN